MISSWVPPWIGYACFLMFVVWGQVLLERGRKTPLPNTDPDWTLVRGITTYLYIHHPVLWAIFVVANSIGGLYAVFINPQPPPKFSESPVGKCIPMVIALLRRIRMRTHLAHRQTINHPQSAIIASFPAEDVDSVTDATANVNELLEGQAAASLQPRPELPADLGALASWAATQPELAHADGPCAALTALGRERGGWDGPVEEALLRWEPTCRYAPNPLFSPTYRLDAVKTALEAGGQIETLQVQLREHGCVKVSRLLTRIALLISKNARNRNEASL